MQNKEIIRLIKEWINHKCSQLGDSYRQADLASDAGISASYLSKIMTGERNAGNKTISRIAQGLGVSVADFYKGPREQPDDEIVHIPYITDVNGISDTEDVFLPHYRVEASAGGGMLITETEINQMLPFKAGWINKILRSTKGSLSLLDVKGDSMEPMFNDGDTIMIDKDRIDLRKEGYYVLRVEDYLYIKWVQRTIDGGILIKSLNESYGSQLVQPEELESVNVLGRVVWKAQTLV